MRGVKLFTFGLALLVLLAACGGGPGSAAAQLSCSLPVITWTRNGGSTATQDGFISVPSGAFRPDPTAAGPTYDRAYQRWLPVLGSQVLPDGSTYAYEVELQDRPGYQVHVVQVASGADKMIYDMPYDNAYSILALEPEGIYLVPILHRSGVPTGLWLLSSTQATLTAVPGASDLSWQVIDRGAAWGGPVGGDSLDRLDLATGTLTTWFHHDIAPQPGIGSSYGPSVVGFDLSGHPLVELYPPVDTTASPARTTPVPELWLVSGPSVGAKLAGISLPGEGQFVQVGVTDSHGAWLVGSDGFYLYTDKGFMRAAPMPPGPIGNLAIAGGCA